MNRSGKHWTKEEINYLENSWGKVNLKTIAKKLNRTIKAVNLKGNRLGLGSCYQATEELSVNVVAKTLKVDNHTIVDYWIAKCGLKAIKKKLIKFEQWFIKPQDLLKWLEENQDKWDSRKLISHGLGVEPEWLRKKRKEDALKPKKFNKWTKEEELLLINFYNMGKKQIKIAKLLNRSRKSIQKKVSRLKEKGLLYKNIIIPWSDKEIKFLIKCDGKGISDNKIAWELGRDIYHIRKFRTNLRERGLYKGNKGEFAIIKETKEMFKLFKQGKTKKEIALMYNLHPCTVTRRFKKYKEELQLYE